MNKEFTALFEKSGLTRKEFAEKIEITESRLSGILRGASELKNSTFEKFKCRLGK